MGGEPGSLLAVVFQNLKCKLSPWDSFPFSRPTGNLTFHPCGARMLVRRFEGVSTFIRDDIIRPELRLLDEKRGRFIS